MLQALEQLDIYSVINFIVSFCAFHAVISTACKWEKDRCTGWFFRKVLMNFAVDVAICACLLGAWLSIYIDFKFLMEIFK